jgi:hypothetical protein
MKSVSMGIDVQYLLGFLEDELKDVEDVRISTVAPSLTQKSMDLPQDYDPNENDIHLLRGVRVRVGSREFYFPASWVNENRLDLVHAQTKEIHELISK